MTLYFVSAYGRLLRVQLDVLLLMHSPVGSHQSFRFRQKTNSSKIYAPSGETPRQSPSVLCSNYSTQETPFVDLGVNLDWVRSAGLIREDHAV